MAIYMWREPIPAWIYRSSTLWLITIADGNFNEFTISDKNLWATQVWNNGDTVSQSNCWYYYQRWNNYWFPFTWSVTTSSSRPDPTWYWPWNYYSSSTFITNSTTWMNPTNDNLWGGGIWWTLEWMRWPCAEWYHVPWYNEMWRLMSAYYSMLNTYDNFNIYLKMPSNWFRAETSWDASYQWSYWYIWTCVLSSSKWWNLNYNSSWTSLSLDERATSRWSAVRPFKNVVVKPDNTWTILYQPS